jgi:guanine deaminase
MTTDDPWHTVHLQTAIDLSRARMEAGFGGPFGAIVGRGSEIIARGWNQVTTRNDPTAHAEIEAIREACRQLGRFDLRGHVLYTSCEPCPMCLGAIYWARLDAVYYANTRADAAAIGFDDDHIYRELELPIAGRSVRFVHRPSDAARAAFRAWQDKPDKIRY